MGPRGIPFFLGAFKQGVGRLIRSSDDEGRIVVLDPRIVSKGYGRKFLDALPAGVRLEYGDQDDRDEMILDMDEWIP